ncbi:ribosomal large subunit pseudouridine synthase B [Buchnera aphidicola str. Bp (Baizongia pistaciae)]|uniref:Ribosomal large subunit pseudouridine synthase B n=1 Tax=Buchnera aphidicola subsp. Baizongia pistaciae (strain Bp) TaxID=224915 RepID=RLUB_BUCBP|nr:pseudouridine synthase [Buchnera aphidicola]Q89AL1.1 RecName: Full=Ribosomal large subunit pseudouridine synthase B; AltName: Full=23S rRNA pseudouridine(2605) synthase; AltName: Full=rRNA pseudouridylate synthase B; AltName: Full=rRNA-uridine isomerase B [Buchnera aphidicola str. Bp (Baizongia pistaciae)]AAO26988.1 ribosomal large subunit pseudouridine synthase B [Buchnera aphidicola str. Bp (Baizongia pistaciae)]
MCEKIQKILARHGYGSRRYIESLIKSHSVKINDEVVKVGQRISINVIQKVIINNNNYKPKLNINKSLKVLLYNKPEGEICTRKDQRNRRTIFEKLPKLSNARWINIGRLDLNSSGLLLFTTDGELAYRLTHPSFNIERIYKVRVFGQFTENILKQLNVRVKLLDGYANFKSIQFKYGEGKNKWFNVSLCEGRHRIVRRIWEKLGFQVNKLVRISYAHLTLPKTLFPGTWITLNKHDIDVLCKKVNLR